MLPPYVAPPLRVNRVVPFTMDDGETYLERLEGLSKYLRELSPLIADDLEAIDKDVAERLSTMVSTVNEALQAQRDAVTLALQEQADAVAQDVLSKFATFEDQVTEWISQTIETNDVLTAGLLDDPDSLARATAPFSRAVRAGLADRYAQWIMAEGVSTRGDNVMQGTIRRGVIRKTSRTSPVIASFSIDDEEPQGTAAGLSLQFLATYAKVYPEKAASVRQAVDRLVATIVSLQSTDERMPHYGGVASSAGFMVYGCLSTAQAVKGLILAYEVFGVGEWLEVAKRGGTFLQTLANPNPVYQSLYGVNVVAPPIGVTIMSERISAQGQLTAPGNAWNLQGAVALMELGRVTGVSSYTGTAIAVRNSMAILLTGFYDYFALKVDDAGAAAGRVTATPVVNASNPIANDNQPHRMGEGTGIGTIETDSMEYALTALWHLGYDLQAIKTAYEYLRSLTTGRIPTASGTPEFYAMYNTLGRFVCWPGYFRINDPVIGGDSEAWGGYLDFQGAGELLEWKHAYYPDDYAKSLPIINAGVNIDSAALMDKDFKPIWTDDTVYGGVYAIQGTVPIAVAGLGLLLTNPDYDMEVSS